MYNKVKTYGPLIVLLCAALAGCGRKAVQDVPLGKVVRGTFYIDLHEEGEIEAVNSINISSPAISWRYGNLKITKIIDDGEEVQAGDTVLVFDPSEVQKAIVESESNLEIQLAELEKLYAQQEAELDELNADYEVTSISHEISRIRLEHANYESEMSRKEIELALEKAEIALERAKEQIDNRKKIHTEDLKQKNLQIEQSRSRLREAHETFEKLFVITPSPGIGIIARNWSSGNKFQMGDQCWAGYPLIQLPDLSKLKATVRINEVDISKIQKGLRAEIRPDAFSEDLFTAEVISVANLAVNKQGSTKIKVFPVELLLNETHKNLLPGITVSCRLIISEIEDVLYVPIDAVHTEGEETYVYRKSGGGYQKTVVETAERNNDYVIITDGLSEKDEVALVDPFMNANGSGETKGEAAS